MIAELKAAKELIRTQDERITELEDELTKAKLAFADATIKQFSSQQSTLHATPPSRSGQTSYAKVTSGHAAPTLVAKLAKPLGENSKMSLEEMEQILNTNSGGPIPASVRQKDSTVYLRLSNPDDLDRATSTLQSRQGPSNSNLFLSVSQTTRLYPVVALFVDLALLPKLREEIMLRNVQFKDKIVTISQIFKKQGSNKGHIKIFFNCRSARDYALNCGSVDFFNTSARLVEPLVDREVRRCFICQSYGHAMSTCRMTTPSCGKCAGPHRTRECSATFKKCVHCAGAHETGDRFCPIQMKAVARYQERNDRM